MCFSASASFTASAILASIGAYAIFKANQRNKYYLGLAFIPFLFGIQQFFEGIVWLSFKYDLETYKKFAAYGFLFFAWFFWPFWTNFATFILNKSPQFQGKRHLNLLKFLIVVSMLLGMFLYMPIFFIPEKFLIQINNCSIRYQFYQKGVFQLLGMLYFILTVVPFFLARDRKLIPFGALLLVSVILSKLIYYYAFTSTWCFFSALLSLYLVYVVKLSKPLKR